MDELSGIERAIRKFGTQDALAKALREKFGDFVSQGRISDWKRQRYVPVSFAGRVAKISDIPVDQLLRKKPNGDA